MARVDGGETTSPNLSLVNYLLSSQSRLVAINLLSPQSSPVAINPSRVGTQLHVNRLFTV